MLIDLENKDGVVLRVNKDGVEELRGDIVFTGKWFRSTCCCKIACNSKYVYVMYKDSIRGNKLKKFSVTRSNVIHKFIGKLVDFYEKVGFKIQMVDYKIGGEE